MLSVLRDSMALDLYFKAPRLWIKSLPHQSTRSAGDSPAQDRETQIIKMIRLPQITTQLQHYNTSLHITHHWIQQKFI